MLRLTGLALVMLGSTGIGLSIIEKKKEHIQALRELERLLSVFISEAGYGRATLPECCRSAAGRVSQPLSETLIGIWSQTGRKEQTFRVCFREGMEDCLRQMPLSMDERTCFLRIMDCFGVYDPEMQKRQMEGSRDELEKQRKKLEEGLPGASRLAMSLSLLGGLFLAVVFL